MSEFWPIFIIVIQLIFLEGILSIDNAAVIGALVTPLPDDQPVEWPRALQRFGKWLHPIIGNQRMAALRVGLLGAYLGRGAMLFMTSFLINNSWIKLIGAAYLIRLAFENLGDMTGGGSEEGEDLQLVKSKASLEKRFGTTVDELAWPFGIYDVDLEKSAEKAGYVTAFSIERRLAKPSEKIMSQPRYLMVNGDGVKNFAAIITGKVIEKGPKTY